jgi:hypothetical protein
MLQHEGACVAARMSVAISGNGHPKNAVALFGDITLAPALRKRNPGYGSAYSVARMKRSDIRGDAGSDGAQIIRRRLSGPTVGNDVERNLLALIEALHAGAFDRADMHEYVLPAALRLNESIALLAIEPFHCSLHHR